MRYVILGSSAAGIFAAEEIRRRDPAGEVLVFSAQTQEPYSRCLTSYYLAGTVDRKGMSIRKPGHLENLKINYFPGVKAVGLNPQEHRVLLSSGATETYDKLLIATGASAIKPNWPGSDAGGVYTLRNLEDAESLVVRAATAKQAVVIGGGLVSLKGAYALWKRGLKVTAVVRSGEILSQVMDPKAAAILRRRLEEKGLEFIFGQEPSEFIKSEGRLTGVRLEDGRVIQAGVALVGKGVRPNTGFLENSGLKLNQGVLVDRSLGASVPDIFAAGDVAESPDLFTGQPTINAIWPNAARQGKIAGANMTGAALPYEGSLAMNSIEFFGLSAISSGLSRQEQDLEVFRQEDPASGTYRKLVLDGDLLVGFILAGDTRGAGILNALIQGRRPLGSKKDLILANKSVFNLLEYDQTFGPPSAARS